MLSVYISAVKQVNIVFRLKANGKLSCSTTKYMKLLMHPAARGPQALVESW